MTSRAVASQLALAALTVSVGVLAEAVASASRLASGSLGAAAWCALWTLGLWAVPAALMTLLLAGALAIACDEDSLFETLRLEWSEPARRDAWLAAAFAAPALLGWVFVVARESARFHNRELAAALTAVTVLGGVLALALGAVFGFRALRRRREAGRKLAALPYLAWGFWLLVLGWLFAECRSGLVQLDPRLLAAPLAALATFAWLDRVDGLRSRGRLVALVSAGLLLVAGVFLGLGGLRAQSVVTAQGVWSRVLVGAVQRLTDFDGDGYSGLLAGGDCAPFEPAINPGAVEIPGDGIDNNCIAGDAGKSSQPRRPIWGASAHGSPTNQNVVVVTIETLRHDHASFLRPGRDTTPTLRALAPESLVFERMYSAAPFTRLAVASLFSSYAPSEIEWLPQAPEKRMRRLGPTTPWFPEMLRARGYETIAVLTDFSAFTPQEDAGFERGFQHYDISTKLEYRGGTMWGFPAAQQVDKAIGYIERAERPFLLWLHLFEPHFRYEQPPGAPVFGKDEQSRYDAEIWHADHQLGRLIDALRQRKLWDQTVLLVTGDHGEAFGEHADRWHGTNLYDPQLRPAALLRVPGVTGKRIEAGVTFTDLAPTLARILGDRPSFEQMRGRSLAPLMHHARLPSGDNSFVAETFAVEDGRAYQAALIAYPLKLIYVETGKTFRLFDLEADPQEQNPLDPTTDPRGMPLLRELVGYLERTRAR
ncbi:MAG TPA: sulfatase-like hydrolase/transferase [Polyangiaceae bacterium]|nr:sulfatase-like hydrolase/transferase [Polyangiaceae bacterium]